MLEAGEGAAAEVVWALVGTGLLVGAHGWCALPVWWQSIREIGECPGVWGIKKDRAPHSKPPRTNRPLRPVAPACESPRRLHNQPPVPARLHTRRCPPSMAAPPRFQLPDPIASQLAPSTPISRKNIPLPQITITQRSNIVPPSASCAPSPAPNPAPSPRSGVGACPLCSQTCSPTPYAPPRRDRAPGPPPGHRCATPALLRGAASCVRVRARAAAAETRAHSRVRPHAHAEANHCPALSWARPVRTRAGPRDRACGGPPLF